MATDGNGLGSERKIAENLFDEGRYEEAFAKFDNLAKSGDIVSKRLVAWMYHRGEGVNKNIERAEKWYRSAVDNGDTQSAYWLAILLNESGDSVQANKFLAVAADRNYAPAIYSLAVSHMRGRGVAQDAHKGLLLLETAAKLGNVKAKAELAKQLIRGRRGMVNRVRGVFMALSVFVTGFRIALNNMEDERLRY